MAVTKKLKATRFIPSNLDSITSLTRYFGHEQILYAKLDDHLDEWMAVPYPQTLKNLALRSQMLQGSYVAIEYNNSHSLY